MVTEAQVKSALERLQAEPRGDHAKRKKWLSQHSADVLTLVEGKGKALAADLVGIPRHVFNEWLLDVTRPGMDGTEPLQTPAPVVQQEPVKDQAADGVEDVVTKDYLEGQVEVYKAWVRSLQEQLAGLLSLRGG